jgi:hypothetical protein
MANEGTLETVVVTGNAIGTNYAIRNLRSKLGVVARPNNFLAYLDCPSFTQGGSIRADKPNQYDIEPTFEFRCERAELPGRTVATSEDMGSGPTMKLGYDMTYNDIQLSVICATDMKERKFFEKWMDYIIKPFNTPDAGTVAYYNDYAKGNTLTVSQLNDFGKPVLTYQCMDVYPIAITPMNATWEETNTYQRFGVTLAYRYHTYR